MKRPSELKIIRRNLEKENLKRSKVLMPVVKVLWPTQDDDPTRIAVLTSQKYMVQIFDPGNGVLRLSCNRTSLDQFGNWEDNLSWDELMEIKRQCGYGDAYAVEILPEDRNIVNVANMRHIWIMPHFIVGWGVPEEKSLIIKPGGIIV